MQRDDGAIPVEDVPGEAVGRFLATHRSLQTFCCKKMQRNVAIEAIILRAADIVNDSSIRLKPGTRLSSSSLLCAGNVSCLATRNERRTAVVVQAKTAGFK